MDYFWAPPKGKHIANLHSNCLVNLLHNFHKFDLISDVHIFPSQWTLQRIDKKVILSTSWSKNELCLGAVTFYDQLKHKLFNVGRVNLYHVNNDSTQRGNKYLLFRHRYLLSSTRRYFSRSLVGSEYKVYYIVVFIWYAIT